MRHILFFFFLFLCIQVICAEKFNQEIITNSAGKITVSCDQPGIWEIKATLEQRDNRELIHLTLHSSTAQIPPKFNINLSFPQKDMNHLWTPRASSRYQLYPTWNHRSSQESQLASGMPLYSFFNEHNQNSFLIACCDVFNIVKAQLGLKEEGCIIECKMTFFSSPVAPFTDYETTILLDNRRIFWAQAIQDAATWIDKNSHTVPCHVPEDAFNPLYSTWYQFHQNVHAKDIEEECAIASKLGMKTIIIDDGWQTDDNNRGYAYCGDWELSKNRFPDMVSHVKKVQDMGMKYMMWYSVPFIGYKSKNYKHFQGKYLQKLDGSQAAILDPRFPEVREFLIKTYETALKTWNLDGFKFDFIDLIKFGGTDPAIAENYAGRDYKSVPEAVNTLMKEIRTHLQRIKPNILIEFRQSYIGPAIRQYGNMIRVGDCPGDLQANRIGIANLRLTSAQTAVHSDMLEWNVEESPLNVARTILSSIFGVIQYSAMLRDTPKDNLNVIKHWIKFSLEHKDALLKGDFRPYYPEAGFPIIEAENKKERIIGIYQDNISFHINKKEKDIYMLNATYNYYVVADVPAKFRLKIYDMYGKSISDIPLKPGLQHLPIPAGGYGKLY